MANGSRQYDGIGLVHGFAKHETAVMFHLLTQLRWGGDLGKVMFAVFSLKPNTTFIRTRNMITQDTDPSIKHKPRKKRHIYYFAF